MTWRRRRIAIVGLGMVVGAHAKSMVDLSDEVEVAYAFSPGRGPSRAHCRRQFPFPVCDSLDTILDDRRVDAVERACRRPARHRDVAAGCAARRQARPDSRSRWRSRRSAPSELVEGLRDAGVTLGVVLAAPLPARRAMRLREIFASRATSATSSAVRPRSACGGRSPTTTSRAVAPSPATAAASSSRRASTRST